MRVLLVDDHALIRQGLVRTLGTIDPSIEVRQAARCAEGLDDAARHPPDLVLLDLQLPDRRGLDVLVAFREALPATPVAVISALESRDGVIRALRLGAKAFIGKSASSEYVADSLRALLEGRVPLPSGVLEAEPRGDALGAPAGAAELSDRQRDVLALVVAGLPNKLIAERLGVTEATVKFHVTTVLRRLGAASRTQLLIRAAQQGIRLPLR
ncbi:MAG: response regulator [Burkholderiales bacterium]